MLPVGSNNVQVLSYTDEAASLIPVRELTGMATNIHIAMRLRKSFPSPRTRAATI